MTKVFNVLACGTALIVLSAQAHAAPADSRKLIADQFICVFSGSVTKANVRAEAERVVKTQGGQLLHSYRNSIRGFATRMPLQALNRMKAANRNIAYCEQDQLAEASIQQRGKPGGGTTTPPPAETVPYGISRVNGGQTSAPGIAWIIDSGIDLDHSDLNVNTSSSVSFVRGDANDENGHGTHVAGTIAAKKNSFGVVGVAPGTQVASVRVLDRRGSGAYSGVIAGVDYVAANGMVGDVANMSLGGGPSDALDAAVIAAASKGVKFALAAGNDSDDANNHSPARAEGPNVFTVSATDRNDTFASFSNYGNPPIDYAEPGVGVYSTYKDNGYATLSGTSMAAPHLAGILLLGVVVASGAAINDPDGKPDTIGKH